MNKNLLQQLRIGDYDWHNYYLFSDHLRLPAPYLKLIFRKCPSNLSAAVKNLHKIFAAVDNHQWERIMAEASILWRKYRVANIPPLYFADKPVVTARSSDQVNFQHLVDSVEKLTGLTFYFHSEFCDAALNAAASIMKRAIQKSKVASCYCASFSAIVAEYKTDWDSRSPIQLHIREDELVVIYAVGGEYTTEFTSNMLQEVLRSREANNKTTIICSALSPGDYAVRYNSAPAGVEIGFVDDKIKKTLSQLVKELKL